MRWSVLVVWCALAAGCGESDPGKGPAEAAAPGEQTYMRFCFSCHAAGVAGAPRTGDAGAWAPRIAKGRESLLQSTIDGIPPGMPPRGLCSDCTDEQLAAAIQYMVERSPAE